MKHIDLTTIYVRGQITPTPCRSIMHATKSSQMPYNATIICCSCILINIFNKSAESHPVNAFEISDSCRYNKLQDTGYERREALGAECPICITDPQKEICISNKNRHAQRGFNHIRHRWHAQQGFMMATAVITWSVGCWNRMLTPLLNSHLYSDTGATTPGKVLCMAQ